MSVHVGPIHSVFLPIAAHLGATCSLLSLHVYTGLARRTVSQHLGRSDTSCNAIERPLRYTAITCLCIYIYCTLHPSPRSSTTTTAFTPEHLPCTWCALSYWSRDSLDYNGLAGPTPTPRVQHSHLASTSPPPKCFPTNTPTSSPSAPSSPCSMPTTTEPVSVPPSLHLLPQFPHTCTQTMSQTPGPPPSPPGPSPT